MSIELELNFTTRNYMALKTALKADNLRIELLDAAAKCNYEVLAKGIKQFGGDKIKDINAAYDVIDTAEDKQLCFYEFISELGEHGFFDKGTPEELKTEALQPRIDMSEILSKVAPEATKEALKGYMKTGANTSAILELPASSVG